MLFILLIITILKEGLGMKLKIGDKVYLQKHEVAYIMNDLNSFPGGILPQSPKQRQPSGSAQD